MFFTDNPGTIAAAVHRILTNPVPRPDGRERRIEDYLSVDQIREAIADCDHALSTRLYALDEQVQAFRAEIEAAR